MRSPRYPRVAVALAAMIGAAVFFASQYASEEAARPSDATPVAMRSSSLDRGQGPAQTPAIASGSTPSATAVVHAGLPVRAESSPGLFDLLDVQAKRDIGPPSWFYSGKSLSSDLAALDSTAAIVGVTCGQFVCRIDIQHASAAAREKFAAAVRRDLSVRFASMATVYRYPDDDKTKTIMYATPSLSVHDAVALVGRPES